MDTTIPSESIPNSTNSTNDIQLHLTKLAVSGFADNAPPPGNLFVELEVDGAHRHRCIVERQGDDIVVTESPSDVSLTVTPSSLVDCELWYESEDKVYLNKLCECTVKITEAISQAANGCEHKSGKHEWTFELHGSPLTEYVLPQNIDEPAEGLVQELHLTLKSLHEVSIQVPRLSGDQSKLQEEFNIAWQFFSYAYNNYHDTDIQTNRAALDDAVKDSLTQLRLGLEEFASRAKRSITSRRALYWYDGLDLVSQSVIQAAALVDKYTNDLASASSRTRSLYLDRCQQLQDDIIRYRLMFIQNGSSSTPLHRDTEGDTLSILMQHLVSSTEYDGIFLSLRGRQAGRALDLLQDVISSVGSELFPEHDTIPPNEIRLRLRDLLDQVAQLSDRVPPSLFLDGIKWNSEVLSRTKFSDVTSGTYKKEKVVIKRIKLPIKNVATDNSQKTKKSLLRVLGWKTLKHESLLPFLGVAVKKPGKDSDGLHLVYPRMEYSSVLSVLGKKGTVDEDVVTFIHRWILEISEAVNYLHGENIIHGDLRARNILVDRNYSIRVADFGLAALAEEAEVNYMAAHPGLARWLAPELLSGDTAHIPAQQTFATDIYAFASVCLELYTRDIPFARTPDKQVASLVLDGTRPDRPSTPGNENEPMVEALWIILQYCWTAEPSQRPLAAEVVEALYTFVHGDKYARDSESEDEEARLTEEPEQMPSRSQSPETVTSDSSMSPNTPTDTQKLNVTSDSRARSVEDYSNVSNGGKDQPVKKASWEDVPSPSYKPVDPTPRASRLDVPVPEQPRAESPSSETQDTSTVAESCADEPPSSVTTVEESSNANLEEATNDEIRNTDEQATVKASPPIGATHDNPDADTTLNDAREDRNISQIPPQHTGEEVKTSTDYPIAQAAPTPVQAGLDPEPDQQVSGTATNEDTRQGQEANQDATASEEKVGNDEAAPTASELAPTAEKVVSDPAQPPAQAPTDDVETPTTKEADTSANDNISSEVAAQPIQPPAEKVVSSAQSSGSAAQVDVKQAPGDVDEVSQDTHPADVVPEAQPASGVSNVSETKETIIDHVQSASKREDNTDSNVGQDVKVSAALKHDDKLPNGAPEATALPATAVIADDKDAIQGTEKGTADGAVPNVSQSHDVSGAEVKEDVHTSAATEQDVQEQTTTCAELTGEQPTSRTEPAHIASPPENPVLAVSQPSEASGEHHEASDGQESAKDAGSEVALLNDVPPKDSLSPVERASLDSELAPPPDPATWDNSVMKRASVRLVNPPKTTSSSDDLPAVTATNRESIAEVTSQRSTKPESDTGIQQEAREQPTAPQSAKGEQSPQASSAKTGAAPGQGATSAARKPAVNPKADVKTKTPRDIDEVQAGCCGVKCIIM